MKSTFFILLISTLTSLSALGQTWPFEVWHEGRIVLLEGDTLRGLVKYDLQKDLVEFTLQDRKGEVFTARKVAFFEIFDESVRKYRQFYTLPFNTAGGYKAPVFFELLEEGKMTLLAREFLESRTYSSSYYSGTYNRIVLSYKYYFLDDDGNITEFNGNKNDLLDMMGKNGDDVAKYMKSNDLRFDDKYDFAKIIAYYNSLSGG